MSELRLMLTRETPQDEHTFGVLTHALTGDRICWTMEPGLRDRDFPRVPTGFYSLVKFISAQDWIGQTFALVGRHVSKYQEPGVDRYEILIHAGNEDDDTQGCIIPGLSRGELNGEPAVLSSRAATNTVLDLISTFDRAYLTIR